MPRIAAMSPRARYVTAVVGSTLVPVSIFTAYLIVSRRPPRWDSELTDLTACGISVVSGALFAGLLPFNWKSRLLLGIAVVISQAIFLFVFGFVFVCSTLGDCL
jgi:hypothetical protein